MMKTRVTIPFETLRSLTVETFDLLPNPVEFRAVVKGKIVTESKDWVGFGWSGDDPATGNEPILVIDKATVRAEIRQAQAKARKMMSGNYDRLWLQCPRCAMYQHYDYVRYSLSNPILVPRCAHGEYEDLHRVVTFSQKAGGNRVSAEWHDLIDTLDREAREYISGLKAKRKTRARA